MTLGLAGGGWRSLAPAAALVALQCGLLASLGLPLTHDGFWHLGWVEGFNHAVRAGWWYPRWYGEAFGGAGSPSFVFYPPLLRLLSLPFGLVTEVPSLQLRGALAALLLLNLLGAWALVRRLALPAGLAALLLALAVLNPYLLINVWLRGAWPEALAMVCLWPIASGLLGLLRAEGGAGWRVLLGVAGLLLAHAPTALLFAYAAVAVGSVLVAAGAWRALPPLALAALGGAALAAFHWLPAVLDQSAIVMATGVELVPRRWPLLDADAQPFSRGLGWIWLWLAAVVGFAALRLRALPAPDRRLALALLALLLFALLLMLPPSALAYAHLPWLGRVQFPWRWLAPASVAGIALLALAIQGMERGRERGGAILLAALGPLAAVPLLHGLQFDREAQTRLDALFACGRAGADCRRFAADGERADRAAGLAFAGQHVGHYGPWLTPDGRVWRSEVLDYLPRSAARPAAELSERGRLLVAPFRPGAGALRIEPPDAGRVLTQQRAAQDWRLSLQLDAAATVELEVLRYPGWVLEIAAEAAAPQPAHLDPGSAFHRVALPAGQWRLRLHYAGTQAERIGTAISLCAVLLVGAMAALRRRRRRASRRDEAAHG